MTEPTFTLDDIEQLLVNHRYWSGDDMTDPACDCGKWPQKWDRKGDPIPGWLDHMLEAAREIAESRR